LQLFSIIQADLFRWIEAGKNKLSGVAGLETHLRLQRNKSKFIFEKPPTSQVR
jgi:hypothetical protein